MFTDSETNYQSDDGTLVYHCLAGDENAFGFLVHKYKNLVHAYTYQKVSNYADAEDITQEVFIRAYRNLAQLKYPHKFRSWLYTIASNECKRWLSQKLSRQEKEVNLEETPEDAFGFEPSFAQAPTDWQIDLEDALKDLPEDNRIAVSMFYMRDCSLKEIGEYLGVSVNTVKSKLYRARQQLGNALSERYGRALSRKKLKGGFIMKIMAQLRNLPRPMIPPAWRGNLLRQIPLAVATAACVLMGVLGVFSEDVQEMEMLEATPLVLGEESSAQVIETAWLGTLPTPAATRLTQATAKAKEETKKEAQALAEADALLAAKKYRLAAGAYRLLLKSMSSDEVAFAAYYGLGTSLYKWERTAGNRIDEAIGMLMTVPKENKHWQAAQVLLGRCFLRKGIWARENKEGREYYETALQAFQDVLNPQTTDDLRKQVEYLRTLLKVERGEANPKTPVVRTHLEMARQDEDAAIRFVAADTLNMPGVRIVGTVTAKLTGQPLADAQVSITGIGNDKTDGQGRFSIDNLPGREGEGTLWADMKGYGRKMVPFMISETEIDTQVDAQLGPGATVAGRVVDSVGRPIAGAKVDITIDSTVIRLVKTDAEGKYQLADIEVRQNAYRLRVEHPDFTSSLPAVSVNKTGIVAMSDIVLSRLVTLEGRVTDESGNAIKGAKIMPSRNVKTDANGVFHLRVPRGNSTIVSVDSPNFMPTYKKVRLDADKELTQVDFVLKPGKTLIGYVVDEQGKPVEDVKLHLETWGGGAPQFSRYAMTDANGEFRLEHLLESKMTLRPHRKDNLYPNEQAVDIEPNRPITTMKNPIVMQKGARAYAKVVNAETGKPIKRFKVQMGFPKQLEPGDMRIDGIPVDWIKGYAFQSDTGAFKTFERCRGMVVALQVESEGYAPTYVPHVVFGAYDKEPLTIRLKKQMLIKGVVVDAKAGKPLAGALIATFDKNHPLFIHGTAPEHRATDTVLADEQGEFSLPGARSEEFYLYATHPERAAAIAGPLSPKTDEKSQPVRVEMQKGGIITGTARPGLKIKLSMSKHHRYLGVNLETKPSREGIYRFENLMPGKYEIQEVIPGEGFERSGRRATIELQPGETKTLNFRRTGGALLYGQVTEADGVPIKNVVVDVMVIPKNMKIPPPPEMIPEYIKMIFKYSGTAITNAEGDYEIAGLPPGNYNLMATFITFSKSGNMTKPRKTTSAFTIAEGDKKIGLDIVFPAKE